MHYGTRSVYISVKHILMAMLVGSSAASFGQATPGDVPAHHWAAQSVEDLYRIGVLRGYPDGRFRGDRPVSRYELGLAIGNLFTYQKNEIDGLQQQLDRIKISPTPGLAVQDLAEFRRRTDALGVSIGALQARRPEIDDLSKTFAGLNDQLKALREKLAAIRASEPTLPNR